MSPKLKPAIVESNPTSVVVLRHSISIVKPENSLQKQKTPKKSKLIVPTAQNTREAVDVDRISYFEAKGQFTILHLSDGVNITAFRILGYFKKLLADDKDFYQIHHSLFVNAEHVQSFRGKTHEVTMMNGAVLEASRRMTSKFKTYWDEFSRQTV